MKKKKMFTLLLSGLSVGLITIASVVSCTSSNSSYSKIIKNPTNLQIANALTSYVSSNSGFISTLLDFQNGYVQYINNELTYNSNNYSSLDAAIKDAVISCCQLEQQKQIVYDDISRNDINSELIDVINATYKNDTLEFSISYDATTATNTCSFSNVIKNNSIISSYADVYNYFSEPNNQVALLTYLLNNNYLTYANKTWDYNSAYWSSWTDAMENVIYSFIENNLNASYNGIIFGNNTNGYDEDITNSFYQSLKIANVNYTNNNLTFTLQYVNNENQTLISNVISINSNVLDSASSKSTTLSNNDILDKLNNYFSISNNQFALLNLLWNNSLIAQNNNEWTYNSNYSNNWTAAFSSGLQDFIQNDPNISYDGLIGSNIESYSLSVVNATKNNNGDLSFTLSYDGTTSTNVITIKSTLFTNLDNVTNENVEIANNFTQYFNQNDNQIALLRYLLDNAFITNYGTGINYSSAYNSLTQALYAGIKAFINSNPSVGWYASISDSSPSGLINISNVNYSYDSSNSSLSFTWSYNGEESTANVNIPYSVLTSFDEVYAPSNLEIVNALASYLNENYVVANYLNNFVSSGEGSWSVGILNYISANPNIAYSNNVFASAINTNDISIGSVQSGVDYIVFNLAYNNVWTTSNIKIYVDTTTVS